MPTTPTYWKDAFLANAGATAGAQGLAQVIGLAGGNILTLWADDTTGPGADYDIIGTIFAPDGTATGAVNVQLNTASTAGEEAFPSAAALPDGGFVIAYRMSIGDTYTIAVQRYDQSGAPVATNIVPNVEDDFTQTPRIAVGPGGDYTLVFERIPPEGNNLIRTITYSISNNQPGPERAHLSSEDALSLRAADVFDNGRIISLSDIFRFSPNPYEGFGPTTILVIRDPSTGAIIRNTELSGIVSYPHDVAVLPNGDYVVVYENEDDNLVYRIGEGSAAGDGISGEYILSGNVDNFPPHLARVVALQDGGFFIAWTENDDALHGQRFNASGFNVGQEMIIDGAADYVSDVSLAHDGRILIAYQSLIGEIFQTILDPRDTNPIGGAGNDVLTSLTTHSQLFGEGGDDALYGNAGNDFIFGGAGNDLVSGGAGHDALYGGIGNDTVKGGVGNDTLFGEDGNDTLAGGFGNDSFSGGAGTDTADFSAATGPITVNLTLTTAQNTGQGFDTFSSIENLIGSAFGDTFTGNNVINRFDGGGGNDELRGGTGNDRLNGDAGADIIVGDGGNDRIDGGADIDRLYGGTGNDTILGGAGADSIVGGPGIDRIDGGADSDRLYADGTADKFVFQHLGGDRIFGFVSGLHDIEIDAAVFGGAAGGFTFRANANPLAPSGTQAMLYDTDDGKLYFDPDGTGALARVHIATLIGAPALAASDITLVGSIIG